MDLQSLKLFLDITQTRSFIRTAEKNYMSASTLSRHIQRMEQEIGQPLFLRDNRQVILTEAGERFSHFAGRNGNKFNDIFLQIKLNWKESLNFSAL